MGTEAIFLRYCCRSRAFCALILLILVFSLCACSADAPSSPAPDAAPTGTAPEDADPVFQGNWTSPVDIGGEVSAALGFDLRPWLSSPLRAQLRLTFSPDGSCMLTRDEGVCADALRGALAACLRELQEQEAGESLGGLALADLLGADPNDCAAALCDELLAPPETTGGRYDAERGEIRWNGGAVSPIAWEQGALQLQTPDGESRLFSPAD